MALKGNKMGFIAVFMTVLWVGAVTVQSQSGCTNVIISMSPCLDYITGNSSTPSSSCCSQLSAVVRSQPKCLCEVLIGDSSNMGLNINKTQALELPNACNVQTPPISNCNSGSPGESPSEAPDSPTSPVAGRGSKTVPSTDGNSSDGTATFLHLPFLLITLLVASYASA